MPTTESEPVQQASPSCWYNPVLDDHHDEQPPMWLYRRKERGRERAVGCIPTRGTARSGALGASGGGLASCSIVP